MRALPGEKSRASNRGSRGQAGGSGAPGEGAGASASWPDDPGPLYFDAELEA